MSDYSQLDAALELLAPHGPDLSNGLTNHAPMAVEALAAMGRADATVAWLEGYRDKLLPRPPARNGIPREAWRGALGQAERVGDWNALFEEELRQAPWPEVLGRWTARLVPGLCAAATHGVIRVGHAARSLTQAASPARVRELADGLGYWASTYQTLPTAPGAGGGVRPGDAITRVPVVPREQRRFSGTIVSSLEALDTFPEFAPVIDLIDVSGALDARLSDITETFARAFLTNAHDGLSAIVFIHSVTGPTAVRSLLSHVPPAAAADAVRYAWQASSALYAAFATAPPAPGLLEPPRESTETLIDMAVANGDEHVIKLTEACLREHGHNPSPVYLAAARHVLEVLVPE